MEMRNERTTPAFHISQNIPAKKDLSSKIPYYIASKLGDRHADEGRIRWPM